MRTTTGRISDNRYRHATVALACTLILLSTLAPTASAGIFSRLVNFRLGEDDAKKDITIKVENGVAFAGLWDGSSKIPLVGLGINGHLEPQAIPALVAEAIQDDKRSRVIDISPVSRTEALVAQGILNGVENMQVTQKIEVHVVTKVWYTHLGYERTKIRVEESLRAFDSVLQSDKVDLHIHVLLQWPRCFDNVYYMNCQQEEANLPQYVKDAGPDPGMNPAGAWKDSWKYLEDVFLTKKHPIESIGVGNFRLQDLEGFSSFARIHPSMLQVNLWSLIYDHQLIRHCHENNVHVQVYDIMERTLMRPEVAPHAYHHIQQVAVDLSSMTPGGASFTPPQILLAWLVQHGVSIVPGVSKLEHVVENAALPVSRVPTLNNEQVETLAHSVEAYLSGKDMELDTPVLVTFMPLTKDMVVYWMHDVDEVKLGLVRTGQVFKETTYPGHFFRFYDAKNKDVFVDYQAQASVGSHVTVYVDLDARFVNVENTPYVGDEL